MKKQTVDEQLEAIRKLLKLSPDEALLPAIQALIITDQHYKTWLIAQVRQRSIMDTHIS